MKIYPLLLCGLAACGFAQTAPDWHHKPTEGDKTTYSMHMVEHLDQGDADVNSTWTETVKKIAPDGSSEVEIAYTDFKITAGGMDIPAPPPEPRTMHFTPRGMEHLDEITTLTSVSRLDPNVFAVFTYLVKLDPKNIGASEETKNGYQDANENGAAKLIAVKDGIAQINLTLTLTAKDYEPPLKGDFTFYVNASKSEIDRIEGKLSSIPAKLAGRYQVQEADFTLKRVS